MHTCKYIKLISNRVTRLTLFFKICIMGFIQGCSSSQLPVQPNVSFPPTRTHVKIVPTVCLPIRNKYKIAILVSTSAVLLPEDLKAVWKWRPSSPAMVVRCIICIEANHVHFQVGKLRHKITHLADVTRQLCKQSKARRHLLPQLCCLPTGQHCH